MQLCSFVMTTKYKAGIKLSSRTVNNVQSFSTHVNISKKRIFLTP